MTLCAGRTTSRNADPIRIRNTALRFDLRTISAASSHSAMAMSGMLACGLIMNASAPSAPSSSAEGSR